MKETQNNRDFELIGKTVFFPKQKILAIGDLHLGYESMLKDQGIDIPKTQLKQTKDDLKEILEALKQRKINLNKIIFLGDVKHYFAFNKYERNSFIDIILFLEDYIKRENIIIIKGNHEKLDSLSDKEFVDFFIEDNIIFVHGDQEIKEINNKEIKYIVMGHLHPAITIADKQKIRAEKYKCFLIGDFNKKHTIILPSFFPLIEGSSINEYISDKMCIIPEKDLKNFEVFAVSENKSIYNFGILKKLMMKY